MSIISRRAFIRAAIAGLSVLVLLLFEVPVRLLRYLTATEDPLIEAIVPGASQLAVIQRLSKCSQCERLEESSIEGVRQRLRKLPKQHVIESEEWMLSEEEFSLWRRLTETQ